MKMYGFAYTTEWPSICFGSKAWRFKVTWSPVYKCFKFYHHWINIKDLWWQRVNSYPFKFFGIFILPNEDIYDL